MHDMKINNKIDDPLWDKIPCTCNHDSVITEYPVVNCIHCKCQRAEDSIPLEDFEINEFDEDGNITGKKTITEITLHNDDLESCIGWTF